MELQAALYTNSTASPSLENIYRDVSDTNITWAIHGGVISFGFSIAMPEYQAWRFFKDYPGYRVCLLDDYVDKPVADGHITDISLTQSGVRVDCRGFWDRHFDQYYVQTVTDTDSTSDVIKDALTNNVPFVSSTQSNIDETSTVIGFWEPPDEGIFPGDLIQKMAALSDSSNNQWNYYLVNQQLQGAIPQLPLPYFKAQVDDGTFDWQVWKKDLAKGSFSMTRSISKLANDVQVIYTDEDGYLSITSAATDSTSQSDFWTREAHIDVGDVPDVAATQYRDLFLNKFKQPMLRYEIQISAPKITNSNGARVPLWNVIKESGGYLRVNDLFPDSTLLSSSWDRKRIGQIMEAEYSGADNTLRVVLDQESNRADAILARIEAFR
jgi:hypothetical protein